MAEEHWMDSRLIDTMGGHQAIEVRLWRIYDEAPRTQTSESVAVLFRDHTRRQYRVYRLADGARAHVQRMWEREGHEVIVLPPDAHLRAAGGVFIFPVMSTWPSQNGWPVVEPEPAEEPDPYWARGW